MTLRERAHGAWTCGVDMKNDPPAPGRTEPWQAPAVQLSKHAMRFRTGQVVMLRFLNVRQTGADGSVVTGGLGGR